MTTNATPDMGGTPVSVWCPFCFKDVPESDTDHNVEDDELIDCDVFGRSL